MIFPVPVKINLTQNKITVKSICLAGDCKSPAEKVFKSFGIDLNGSYKIEIKLIDSEKTTYIKELSRLSDEKYFLNISAEGTLVEAATEKGAFRALNTLAKIIVNDELCEGVIEDYPAFVKRGYIEGFYGKTWCDEKRRSVMELMAKYGMNTFYYAPKDDAYHREKWREEYPEDELCALKNLFETAQSNYLDFYWCIGPGLTYHYSSQKDFDLLINKIKSVYKLGVKNFGLLLDDIPWDFQYEDDKAAFDGIVDAHIKLINDTYKALNEFDSSICLTVCPTQYSGDENGYYISKFGQRIPNDVSLFWTGEEICSRVLTVRESDELFRSTGHKPLFWDNYPVNDCEMFQEMHLGAIKGRDVELYKACEGLISNVMEYAECSKIPLMTIADYLWNPYDYNPEKSLENAHKELLGEKAELFGYFADHLGVSCLSKYSSSLMSSTLAHINFLASKGNKDGALQEFKKYNFNMRKCFEMLKDTSVPLFAEMQKWVKKFGMCCDLLDQICKTQEIPTEENMNVLAELTEKYNSDGVILTGFCLREAAEKTLNLY